MHTDPFAYERIRFGEAEIRRQVARAPRRPTRKAQSVAAVPAQRGRLVAAFAGAFGRGRNAGACTDC